MNKPKNTKRRNHFYLLLLDISNHRYTSSKSPGKVLGYFVPVPSAGFGEVSALHHVPPCTISLDHRLSFHHLHQLGHLRHLQCKFCNISVDHPLLFHHPHHLGGHHDQCLSFQHPRLFGHHDHHDHKVAIDQVASFFTTFTK